MKHSEGIMYQQGVGRLVRRCLRARWETQRELAWAIGVSESALSRYLNGSLTLTLDTLAKIAGHLGVSVGYLLGDQLTQAQLAAEEEKLRQSALAFNAELLDPFSPDDMGKLMDRFDDVRERLLSIDSIHRATGVRASVLRGWFTAYCEGGKPKLMERKKKRRGRPKKAVDFSREP